MHLDSSNAPRSMIIYLKEFLAFVYYSLIVNNQPKKKHLLIYRSALYLLEVPTTNFFVENRERKILCGYPSYL